MKQIIFLLFSSILFAEITFNDVSSVINETVIDMPDINASTLTPGEYFIDDDTTMRINFESNTTMKTSINKDGKIVKDTSEYLILEMPKLCVDPSSDAEADELSQVGLTKFYYEKDYQKKRIAIGLPKHTSTKEYRYNLSVIEKTRCIEAFTNTFPEGKTICGDCTNYYIPELAIKTTTADDKEIYIPNNQALKNNYKFNPNNNKGIALLQKMFNNNALSKGINANNLDTIDPNNIPEDAKDSEAAKVVELSKKNLDAMFITQIKQNTVKCFVKRKLVPRYYCPIPGMEFGAQTGGTPEDDLEKAKAECDSYCRSESYSCKSAPTGYDKEVVINNEAIYNFDSTLYEDMQKQEIEFVLNNELELNQIEYDVNLNLRDINTTELIGEDVNLDILEIKIAIKVAYKQTEDSEYTSIAGPTLYKLNSGLNKIIVPQMPKTDKIKITIYRPQMKHDSYFLEVNIKDIIESIKVSNIKIQYSDNRYYFCSYNQIIIDSSTQCLDGRTYEIDGDAEKFLICSSPSRERGPEMNYGAYYTQNSCEERCREKKECIETLAHYSGDATSESSYEITVGCVDSPYNTNCSKEICESKFRDHQEMPAEEMVYDTKNSSRKTVISGVQVAGVTRPKVLLDDEYAATTMIDYDSLFLDETKDQAYQNMISDGTFEYTKATVGEGQPSENAYREESQINTNIDAYTNTLPGKKIYWKLKPASIDINNGENYYMYKVAMTEQMYRPACGTFMEDGYMTTDPQRGYKDKVYSYITLIGNRPFYIKEYDEVFIDVNINSNSSPINSTGGWTKNYQHAKKSYISYEPTLDTYVPASSMEPAKFAEIQKFSGNRNYEEFLLVSNMSEYFANSNGGVIHSQTVTENEGALPVKHYSPANNVDGENASIVNYHFYGIYSNVQLSNEEIIAKLEEDSSKYLIYRATKGSKNKKIIYGDGAIKKKRLKIFVKGKPNSTTLSVDIRPRIEDEDKDVVMFMFMFEGELK